MTTGGPDISAATGSIGICLSGGGYRAAAFHLGTLAYLDRVGLGGSVRKISTVSGGTFIGAAYAFSLVEKTPFEQFFRDFYGFLRDTHLVERGLARLAGPPPTTPSGRHDLIVAMADVYAGTFMRSPKGHPYLFGQLLDADIDFTEAVFNATELRHGLAFRFQKSANPQAYIGNRRLHISRDAAAQIRVADIVAASSCFPGGFEPLSFPYDFTWPDGEVPPELVKQFTDSDSGERSPVGLMDGGIYDNQGAESLLYADARDGKELELGVFVISDVDEKVDDLYPYPVVNAGDSGPTLGRLAFYSLVVLLLCVSSVLAVAVHFVVAIRSGGVTLVDLFLYVIPLVLVGLVTFALWSIRRLWREVVLPMIPQVGRQAWKDLRKLRLYQLTFMLHLRVTSLLTLATSVFMKRIRALVYGLVYRDPKYEGKRISNLVYNLASESPWPEFLPNQVPKASPALRCVADVAATMPTTLWFDESDPYQLPCLVATGQATICFNLMKWIARKHPDSEPSQYPPDVRALWDRLLADWETQVREPYALLQDRLPHEKLAPASQEDEDPKCVVGGKAEQKTG